MRILIIRPGALGDLIVTLPALGAIRRHFRDAHIELMGYLSFLELLKGRFYADAISRFDQADVAPLFLKNTQMPLSSMKRFGELDMVVSFVLDKERVFAENLGATGVRNVIHYEPFPSGGRNVHMVDYFMGLLDVLGINHFSRIPTIFLNREDICYGNNFFKNGIVDPQKMLVAVHPGSGGRLKCWPVDRFAELIVRLHEQMNAQVLLISGPADREVAERLAVKVRDAIIRIDQLPLPPLAALIKQCNLFIGNDSGITHMAAALGVKTIALFGPTDPNVWAPVGEQVKILYKGSHCSPCLQDTRRNCFSPVCLEMITVEDVFLEVMK